MITQALIAAGLLLDMAPFPPRAKASEKALPQIADTKELSIEMAKALVAGDRERFTALAATREEMEQMLETAQKPASDEERQEIKGKVAEILVDRAEDFDRFQTMKKEAGVEERAAARFELIDMDLLREKDGMRQVRHSRVRMIQTGKDGKEEAFLIGLDDMFLFPRGWAFTSSACGIGKEPPKK